MILSSNLRMAKSVKLATADLSGVSVSWQKMIELFSSAVSTSTINASGPSCRYEKRSSLGTSMTLGPLPWFWSSSVRRVHTGVTSPSLIAQNISTLWSPSNPVMTDPEGGSTVYVKSSSVMYRRAEYITCNRNTPFYCAFFSGVFCTCSQCGVSHVCVCTAVYASKYIDVIQRYIRMVSH